MRRARAAVELGRQLNQRIVVQAPWEMAKDPGQRHALGEFLYRLLEAIRLIAVMAWPVMPAAIERVLAMMGLAPGAPVPQDLSWGRLEPGTTLPPVAALFPRIEVAGAEPRAPREKKVEDTQAQAPGPAMITIDEFAKLELRVALVKAAEKIPGSKKLLKLQVDLGDEVRQIVSGIADAYTPESLVGRKVVLVANLKPAKLMGVESFGMVWPPPLDGRPALHLRATFPRHEGEVILTLAILLESRRGLHAHAAELLRPRGRLPPDPVVVARRPPLRHALRGAAPGRGSIGSRRRGGETFSGRGGKRRCRSFPQSLPVRLLSTSRHTSAARPVVGVFRTAFPLSSLNASRHLYASPARGSASAGANRLGSSSRPRLLRRSGVNA